MGPKEGVGKVEELESVCRPEAYLYNPFINFPTEPSGRSGISRGRRKTRRQDLQRTA
jgi:hypothetical protein